ncbi:MAG: hypothetical protein FJ318_10055 [SAR202 cluster bacterium]|nr:hypothetical protein [SAR202 cluster bacterium]
MDDLKAGQRVKVQLKGLLPPLAAPDLDTTLGSVTHVDPVRREAIVKIDNRNIGFDTVLVAFERLSAA